MDNRSKWIWLSEETPDQYADFTDCFEYGGRDARLLISADSNYAVWLNGTLVHAGQYPDFPHYKIFDSIDLTSYCRAGENRLCITVWYYGESNMSYFPGKAALRYELRQSGQLCACSCEHTLSRPSPAYAHGLKKIITGQLGFSFRYDMTKEDGWLTEDAPGFGKSRVVDQDLPLAIRPILRTVLLDPVEAKLLTESVSNHVLADLGREEVGFLTLRIFSEAEQDLLITYGEHIADGGVRRLIGGRDFSVEVHLKPGMNEYLNPFRRLGLRYLEAFSDQPVRVEALTVRPVVYPLMNAPAPQMTEQQKQIYDVCVRTLQLCMHDHYEDSPWREQALYAMDSRNQMLCGYYAFREFDFARASLLLFSKDQRPDELLSICTPSSANLTIPSFSLHYFVAVAEYTLHSGDLTLAQEVYPKLRKILSAFTSRIQDGCVPIFTEACHWNFYEWSEGLQGSLRSAEAQRFDAALNCMLALALRAMHVICTRLGVESDDLMLADQICDGINARFYDAEKKLYRNSTADGHASELVNALAVLCGAARSEAVLAIADHLTRPDSGLTKISLSMNCFKYDALLMADAARWKNWVLDDIAHKYQRMLDEGATAVWETETGEQDFDLAGSLCHGWSAMPVYYYHTLLS